MTEILIAIAILGGLGLGFGLVLAAASKVFYVETDPRLEKLNECLPGANCGGCGYPGCGGYAEAVLNGDKVFWERRTDSLLYDADISVAGEACALLNDFKLKDFTDIAAAPDTGSGIALLTGKTARVDLGTAVTASRIYLYDNPSQTDNILSGSITFDDGSELAFGPLNEDGSATGAILA